MTMFKLIINCGPCEEFIEQCLDSVLSQTVQTWEAYVTVDPCGDHTFSNAVPFATRDPRIRVQKNYERRYSLRNQLTAIRRSGDDPEDIIVSLDGDDWFSGPDSLQIISDTYAQSNCWMTYGSWISNAAREGKTDGMWLAYPDNTTDFRHTRWLGTAVRTWKRWLWRRLKDEDLRDAKGAYLRVAEDRAIMIPLLEMCGTERAKHIAAPIMVYNELSNEAVRNVVGVERRPMYARLSCADPRINDTLQTNADRMTDVNRTGR
jgi:glycosyltransferase involved in cell wall biosynthesis